MEQAILNVQFVPNMGNGTVEPVCPQYGGVQGDRNATRLTFLVPEALRGSQFRYRIEGEDGAGGFISTAPLALDDEGCVETLLDERFTAAGGQILVRLVVSEVVNDNEVTTVRSFDGRLFFADAPTENVSSAFRDTLSAMVARTEGKLDAMTALSETMTETVNAMTARTAAMEDTLDDFGGRLTTAENAVDTVEDRVDAHDSRFTEDEETADELDQRVQELSDKIQNLHGLAEMKEDEATPWKFIQKIVRAGLADQLFSVGDRFVSEHRVYGNIVWEIVDIDHDTPVDDRFSHSITLQTVDCLHAANGQYDLKEYDAPSTTYPNGCSDWDGSDLREWLNSKDAAGRWFVGDEPEQTPPDYAAQAGFMNGMSDSFLAVVGTVVTPVALNSTHTERSGVSYDKFFLPSRVELYAGNATGNTPPQQGTVLARYGTDYTSLNSPSVVVDTNRIKLLNTTATGWWTRSPNPLHNYTVMEVAAGGSLTSTKAKEKFGVAPMCCIY